MDSTPLDDAAGRHNAQARGEHARDDADEGIEGILLFALAGLRCSCAVFVHGTAGLDVADCTHGVVHIADLVADDDLVLTALLDDGGDAVDLFQDLGLCFALIFQRKAQTGDAVGQRNNVVLAADILNNDAGKTIVFTCHIRYSFSTLSGQCRGTAFQRPVPRTGTPCLDGKKLMYLADQLFRICSSSSSKLLSLHWLLVSKIMVRGFAVV